MWLLTEKKIKEVRVMRVRWIFYLLSTVFIIFFILFILGLALSEDFPFKDWNLISVIRAPDGTWGIVLQSPDKTEAVLIILAPMQVIPLKARPPPDVRVQEKGG